jgi:hypothetical protein
MSTGVRKLINLLPVGLLDVHGFELPFGVGIALLIGKQALSLFYRK